MKKYLNKIPEFLTRKELRDKKRYQQKDIAAGSGLTESAVSRIMRYEQLNNVPFESILRMADWLGVENPRDLVDIVEEG